MDRTYNRSAIESGVTAGIKLIVGFWCITLNNNQQTMATREQLQSAVILCNEQEKHVEILQLTLTGLTEDWGKRATLWYQQVIPQLQENAVLLDGLLEQMDEGKVVEHNQIPPTPVIYTRLLTLEKHKETLKDPCKWFEEAVTIGNADLLDLLLQDPRVDPSVLDNFAIRRASAYGHLAVVDRLLRDPRIDPSADNNLAIRLASEKGHLAVVDRLLQDPRVDPSAWDSWAIRWASENGHLAVVDRLLQEPRVDPSADKNWAIRFASERGHLPVVERLLQDPRVDPSADSNYAIRRASVWGRLAVVNRLLQDPRVNGSVIKSDA